MEVLTHYGAPAEILTDQGDEFQGEFAELLESLLIDHRETSRSHPQSNGLTERMVQTIKMALRKYCQLYDRLLLGSLFALDCYGLPYEWPYITRRVLTVLPPVWTPSYCWKPCPRHYQ
jgi:transposase InsO family protein